jgi:ABC-type uncharacterized transport system ATPase subunit
MNSENRDSSIIAHNLVKRYGSVTALDGLNLEVRGGTVLGLLGPNGAGSGLDSPVNMQRSMNISRQLKISK